MQEVSGSTPLFSTLIIKHLRSKRKCFFILGKASSILSKLTSLYNLQFHLSKSGKPADKSLLKITALCEIFQVTKPTLYEWVKQGKLKSTKIQSR